MSDLVSQNLNMIFKTPKGETVHALKDVNFTLKKGELLTVLGPSGCGKTTTLRMIAGLESPDNGEIHYGNQIFFSSKNGKNLKTEKRKLGLMFQSYALWPHMTVFQNIVFGLVIKKKSFKEKEDRYKELEKLFHLEGLRDRYPSELSGGQQQRVALARMLAVKPSLLLLDEPLSNLDSNLRLEMRAELKRLHQALGCTIIFVTHDQMEAMTLATSIAVMNKGVIEQLAKPMDIYRTPKSLFVGEFVGSPPMNVIPVENGGEIVECLVKATKLAKNKIKTFGVRPESIRMVSADKGEIEAIVETIQPTGADWIVGLIVSGKSVFAISSEQPRSNVGQKVGLSFKLEGLHVFDDKDQRIKYL